MVTCLHSSLFTLSPQVPIRHLASDTPAFRGSLSCTIIFLALGFQAGLLASSISLPNISEHVACNYPDKESSVTPHCPEGEVGALPWLLGPVGPSPALPPQHPPLCPQMCSSLHLGWLFVAPLASPPLLLIRASKLLLLVFLQ